MPNMTNAKVTKPIKKAFNPSPLFFSRITLYISIGIETQVSTELEAKL
jgi:hypothetical protein